MSRPIDADTLYERICDLEAQALAYVRDETDPDNLRGWSAILAERTAFKHDVFDAPTIELEPQWIPCSERLPEHELVLVQFSDGDFSLLQFPTVYRRKDMVAWMPLPEPYREDTHE